MTLVLNQSTIKFWQMYTMSSCLHRVLYTITLYGARTLVAMQISGEQGPSFCAYKMLAGICDFCIMRTQGSNHITQTQSLF